MATNNNETFNPEVYTLIEPICRNITAIVEEQKINPMVSHENEPKEWRREKQKCVHWVFDGPKLIPAVRPDADGTFKCRACGRTLYTNFADNSGSEICMQFIDVVNSLLFFGMENKMYPERIQTLIQLKTLVPRLAQEWSNLCEFIRRSSTENGNNNNLGEEYNPNSPITTLW